MKKTILVLGLVCFIFMSGCKKNLPTSPDFPSTESLKINYFTATPEGVLPRMGSTLSWSVSNASYVKLEGDGWTSRVEAMGTKDVGPGTYILTASNATTSIFKTVTVRVLAFVELMKDSVGCQRNVYYQGDEVFIVDGQIENIGGETAHSVMVKVMLFDPAGNFLDEKYATLSIPYPYEVIGTVADMPQFEQLLFHCRWIISENLEMIKQLDYPGSPYRPDVNPEKCIAITWND